jgi:hypothetical protein
MARKDPAYQKAYDRFHIRGTILMRSHSDGSFCLIPGFRVSDAIAERLLSDPRVVVYDGGLFPNNPQTWIVSWDTAPDTAGAR